MAATLDRRSVQTGSDVARVKEMTTEELRQELTNSLGITAKHLVYMAAVWKELESRGEDLSDLRSGLVAYLPMIAAGIVIPEVVIRFSGNKTLLRSISLLTPELQKRIADGESVPVVERQGATFTHRMLPAHSLSFMQIRQVFGERVLRSIPEQTAILTAPQARSRTPRVIRDGSVEVDRITGEVRIGRNRAPVEQVLTALRKTGYIQ